jgi:hypothetical protein
MLPPLLSERRIFDAGIQRLQEYAARAKVVAEKRKEEFDAFAKTVTRTDITRYNRFQRSKGANGIRVQI